MQCIDFISGLPAQIDQFDDLKSKELLYIRIKSLLKIDIAQKIFIKKACQFTSEVILSIPFEEYADKNSRNSFLALGIKGFALRMRHSTAIETGDLTQIETFKLYDDLLPQGKILIAEFDCSGSLFGLATAISEIYKIGSKFVVLNENSSPETGKINEYKSLFEKLRIRGHSRLFIYFPFWNPWTPIWNLKTENTFSGLEFVHIDVSNRCTHSCVFCGLYGPEAVFDQKMRSGGSLPEPLTDFMKKEINPHKCLEIIESLPWTVKSVQFGGVGDPLMHSNAIDFIEAARLRGFKVEVLTNMEYLDQASIERLHSLGGKTIHDLHLIANISGGTEKVYLESRPRQKPESFHRVINNLKSLSHMRKNHPRKHGVSFTIMCVVTRQNALYLDELAKLAVETGADRIWFKPLEVHSSHHAKLIPIKDEMPQVALSMKKSLEIAARHNIEILQKDYCKSIIHTTMEM
jgi:MoaA/NifB/PqqE/SkfB family radical SAM enzyme